MDELSRGLVDEDEDAVRVAEDSLFWQHDGVDYQQLKESIELMGRLWREERVTFEGAYYRTELATIYDRPETPVPIYVDDDVLDEVA